MNIIRQMFRWGVENELVPETTWRALTAVASLKSGRTTAPDLPPVEPVSDDIVTKTIPFMAPVIAAMVRIHQLTGMRPSEVCAIRPCDIYREGDVFPQRYAFLQQNLGGYWIYLPAEYKTEHFGKERWVPLGPKCQEILTPYLAECKNDEFVFSPLKEQLKRRVNAKRPKQNPHLYGTKYSAQVYRYAIDAAIERHNKKAAREGKELIPHWFPYQLRHSKATEARANGDIEVAQIMLGHSNIKTTEIYAKKNKDLAIQHAVKNC